MTLSQIADQILTLVNAETSVVAISEDAGDTIVYEAAVGKHATFIQGKRSKASTSGLCGAVLESGQSALVCNPKNDARIRQDIAEKLGITTALAVPVHLNGALIGALMVLNRRDETSFTEKEEKDLIAFADSVAELIHSHKP